MKRILVVDDNETFRLPLRATLQSAGYEVETASEGGLAVKLHRERPFDLVITDIRMPGLTGLDVLSAAKKLRGEMPVIVITAFGGEEVCRRSIARGADGYLEKPIHFQKLRSLIHDLISPKQMKIEREGSNDIACT